jgi:hypothetical protein
MDVEGEEGEKGDARGNARHALKLSGATSTQYRLQPTRALSNAKRTS